MASKVILADTDSITLLTGKPGSGKTQRVVKLCKQAVDKGELLFVCNLNGLKLPHIKIDDPTKWRDLPAGSLLVVDEAQDFFRTRRGGEAPEYIQAMEKIRHWGVRLVLTTQQPDYLDAHLRGLVGMHEHLVRENGATTITIFRHNEVMENVRSSRARGRYDTESWTFEPQLFDLYESAQVHTVKRRMASRTKRGLIMAGCAALLLGFVVYKARNLGVMPGSAPDKGQTAEALPLTAGREARRPAGGQQWEDNLSKHTERAKAEYLSALMPRAAELPWSAPLYDGRKPESDPRLFCAISHAGVAADGAFYPERCSCRTEQATRYKIKNEKCRELAVEGQPYNPFMKPEAERMPRVQGRAPAAMAQSAAPAPEAAGIIANVNAARGVEQYGTFRNQAPSADQVFEGHF